MSKFKYDYEVKDIDALEAFAKNSVMVIPAIKKPIRSQITAMLRAGVDVPGIVLKTETKLEEGNKNGLPFITRKGIV